MAKPTPPPTTTSMQAFGAAGTPEAGAATRAGLVLLYAPEFESFSPAYLLTDEDLIIGRDPEAPICVPQGAVSRQHARISYRKPRWVLEDLGGRNGTLVDGRFVREVELEHLHEIRVGDAIFKFVEAGAEHYKPYRLDGRLAEGGARRAAGTWLVGGYQIDRLAAQLRRVAPAGISVILLGESGTGKELFARQLHEWSGRRGRFVALNCAAVPPSLLESEVFGYRRGAFTGADRDRPGHIRAADGGTLLLDEIGDMPLEAQAKLLRVLQQREIVPLGATAPEPVDVRVVCATNRDLGRMVAQGAFRGDLYARLHEYSLTLPPLRERKEDVYQLCRAFLARHGREELGLSFPFLVALLHHDYPFNVRELEAIIKRGVALAEGGTLDTPHLPDEIAARMRDYARPGAPPSSVLPSPPAPRPSDAPEARTGPGDAARGHDVPFGAARVGTPSEAELRATLERHRGNVAAVGREYGKERMQIHRWMKRYGIDASEYR